MQIKTNLFFQFFENYVERNINMLPPFSISILLKEAIVCQKKVGFLCSIEFFEKHYWTKDSFSIKKIIAGKINPYTL